MSEKKIMRATGLLVMEVVNSNPNGDPDRESDPRQRPNGLGEISPVSFKRKLRELIGEHDSVFWESLPEEYREHPEHYEILESRDRKLETIKKEMGDVKHYDHEKFLQSAFVKKYWDARIFGNTFLDKELSKEYIKTGVVQFGVGISLSPVKVLRETNTKKAGVQEDKSGGMAPMGFRVVEHGVYCMPFFVNPNNARRSGCEVRDIELLKLTIPYAYDLNRSAVRPDVRIRHAWYVEHRHVLGSCPDYLIQEALTPKRLGDIHTPSSSWADYEDVTALPEDLAERVASVKDLMQEW